MFIYSHFFGTNFCIFLYLKELFLIEFLVFKFIFVILQLICHVVLLFAVQQKEAVIHLHMCSVAKPCLTFCDSVDCSLPDSPVRKIFQTRILEWVAFSNSRGSSWPKGWTRASCISYKASEFFTTVPPGKPPYHTSSYPMYMGLTKRFGHRTKTRMNFLANPIYVCVCACVCVYFFYSQS